MVRERLHYSPEHAGLKPLQWHPHHQGAQPMLPAAAAVLPPLNWAPSPRGCAAPANELHLPADRIDSSYSNASAATVVQRVKALAAAIASSFSDVDLGLNASKNYRFTQGESYLFIVVMHRSKQIDDLKTQVEKNAGGGGEKNNNLDLKESLPDSHGGL